MSREQLPSGVRLVWLLLLGLSYPQPSHAATYTLYAITNNGDATDWLSDANVLGAPQADCQNANNYAHNEIRTSANYLEVIDFTSLVLAAGEAITGVFVDVNGRYDSGTSNNRFGLRVRGNVSSTTLTSPTWSQGAGDDNCAYRFGGQGWNITALRASWTPSDIQDLILGVRRFDNNDAVGTSLARANAFKIEVTTGFVQCSGVPMNLNFPTTQTNSFSDQAFTITNTGVGILSGTVSISECTEFSIVSGASFNLAANQSQQVTVRFSPNMATEYNCNASVVSTPAICAPSSVPLHGWGDLQPSCSLPALISFDHLRTVVDTTTITVSNQGGGTLTGFVSLQGSCNPPFSIVQGSGAFSLAAGQFIDVKVRSDLRLLPESNYGCTLLTGSICGNVALQDNLTATEVGYPPASMSSLSLRTAGINSHRVVLLYTTPSNSFVNLALYDLRGRRVRTLLNNFMMAGNHVLGWDLRNQDGHHVAAGIYLAKLVSGGDSRTCKIVCNP